MMADNGSFIYLSYPVISTVVVPWALPHTVLLKADAWEVKFTTILNAKDCTSYKILDSSLHM